MENKIFTFDYAMQLFNYAAQQLYLNRLYKQYFLIFIIVSFWTNLKHTHSILPWNFITESSVTL